MTDPVIRPGDWDAADSDIPRSAVRLAFLEAAEDAMVLRARHVERVGCGGACSIDLLLMSAQTAFERWSEPWVDDATLQGAILALEFVGSGR